MAFIDKGWHLSLTFVDAGANVTTRRIELVATDDAGDLTDVIADVQTIVAAYIAASDAVLVKQTLGKDSVEDSVTLPTTSVNVEENLQVSAKIFGTPNKSAVFEIPAPKIAMFAATSGPGRNQALFSNGLLGAVVNLYKDDAQAFISDGESITDQGIKGKRVHHKSTKG
jgi:hypothetical protein